MSTQTPQDKFKDMDYETAIGKLNSLIGILERSEGTFEELIEVYKEAFEYYNFCCEYLSDAALRIKELNAKITSIKAPTEDK
ncbi:MAG: exodeoxyribonuclease VII small subunit [Ruminococcus sp.]|nr:exodeoxyribonuclease VII small subunit [Ruminococcus sp.]